MTTPAKVVKRGAFDRCPYVGIERTLAADPQAWIETHRLMAAIESNFARIPMPDTVRAHLRKRLDGEARKRKGRGRPDAAQQVRDMYIFARFVRIEAWLTARKKKRGLKGWRFIRDADWWKGPPSERAARMIRHSLDTELDWESVRNIAYRLRKNGLPVV